MNLIFKALDFAVAAHSGQTRKGDGKPYITHPVGVALILAKLDAPGNVIAAGLLHDVLEDTSVTYKELEKEFGKEITRIVDDVTEQDKSLPWAERKRLDTEHIEVMDEAGLLVKTADKIHNLCSMLEAYKREGAIVFDRFNSPLPDQVKMDKKLYFSLKKKWARNSLLPQLKQLVERLEKVERSKTY